MKVLRIDSWNTVACPCCKQDLFVVVGVPEERTNALKLIMMNGYRTQDRATLMSVHSWMTEQPDDASVIVEAQPV
jgi:hypothetical protein